MSWFKKIHILGNGPSIKHFPSDIDGVRIGTNFSDAKLKPVWTFINDRDPFEKVITGDVELDYPIVISTRVTEKSPLYEKKPKYEHTTILYIIDFIKYLNLHPRLGLNSAQMATHLAINLYLPAEVHIWGCDSLWSDDITSSTDSVLPKIKNPSITDLWRKQWDQLFSEHPKRQFILHGSGTPQLQSQSNVRW